MVNKRCRGATDQSEAGPSTPRQPVLDQPQTIVDQPGVEPQIPFSPLPSTDEKLSIEELKSKITKYKDLIEKHTGQRKDKRKGKQMVRGMQVRRKPIYCINDKILKCMLRIMERFNARGFVYGMVPEIRKPLTGASDSLRGWWKEHVMFDKKASAEVDQFHANKNSLMSPVSQKNESMSTIDMLMELSDPTLGSILSILMQNCSPKQRQFPLSKGVPPPWWPTGNEDWWGQTQIPREKGPPPYRKPHDLNKKWKSAVLLAVIKHMSPNFLSMYDVPHRYKYLVDRMSAKELKYWNMALREEAKLFCSPTEPLEHKFSFLIEKPSYNSRTNVIISSGMVSAPGAFGQRHFSSASSNQIAQSVAPSGVGHELPSFAPSSSHYLAWPTTMPLIGQSQQGAQMSSHSFSTLLAPSGSFAPAGFSQQPPSYSFATSSEIWPTTMPMLGQNPQATSHHRPVVAPRVGDSTSGMQVQNQSHNDNAGGSSGVQ